MDPELIQLAETVGTYGIWGIVAYKLIEVLADATIISVFLVALFKGIPYIIKQINDID